MALDDREIATRIKAARVLRRRPEDKEALPVEELAKLSPLPENELTRVWIGRVERAEVHAPPMKLEKLAEALSVPYWFFTEPDPFAYGPDETRDDAATPIELGALLEMRHTLDRLAELLLPTEDSPGSLLGGGEPGEGVITRLQSLGAPAPPPESAAADELLAWVRETEAALAAQDARAGRQGRAAQRTRRTQPG